MALSIKNTRPITVLEVIRKSLVKLFYNRLSAILAAHNVLKGGNFADLPGGTCHDPIITLESIIHDANHNNSPLWILSQDIFKAFDSVNLTILKFALERIRLPASAITFILSLFMNRSNRIFTAYGETSSYWVRIGIDQGEVISPLLWVIYLDPLLTVLKKEMLDPYILRSPTLLSNLSDSPLDVVINNLVFMDDSTLISSSKAGLEYMLSITEEFYALNNTSANHQKYVLISNSLPLTTTSTILPVEFHLSLSSLNDISSISVTPLSITSSFCFLGVWFNIKGSRDFVTKQIAGECNSFAATLRLAPNKLFIFTTRCSFLNWSTHKANFSCSLPNPMLYLSQALGLINLSSHLIQCHVNNLFLMANSSTPRIQCLFLYRLMLIQFRFLIPVSPLMVDDWSLWSCMTAFKRNYITCTLASLSSTPFRLQHACFSSSFPDFTLPGHTPLYLCMSPPVFKTCLKVLRKRHLYYLSQLIAPSGSHLISWTVYQTAYIAQLVDKRGHSLPYKWYLDIKANTTLPDSHDQLYDRYVCPPFTTSSVTLVPAAVIYAALRASPDDSTITIYTDSQAAIDGLSLCVSSSYSNSRLYYKTTNFELWASIECSIHTKRLTVFPVKVKGHDGNYWNEFADSLANSAHHSDTARLLLVAAYTSLHNVRLVYDNVVCESNPRRLFKLYFQATFLKELLSLRRFQFIYCLRNKDDYVVDWNLTWFTLNFSWHTTPLSWLLMLHGITPSNSNSSSMICLSWGN
ncbi:hypothetical protein RclHR1_20930005 [Rhizophagus clarus]|uniref:Reverse transcriptase domain-containing protein n=1 Tax=Rhizophagus clarus TaxID=94130 RepID=A0A2Z6QWR4_9GLOM|nr:hypothetical protein RclHR1_20930005 [Rhizophagus clarus]